MTDYAISGAVHVTKAAAAVPIRAHVGLCVSDIDNLAQLLHIVSACANSPARKNIESNYNLYVQQVRAYVKNFPVARVVASLDPDKEAPLLLWCLSHDLGSKPRIYRVDGRKDYHECLEVLTPSGVFAHVLLRDLAVRLP